MVDFDKYLKEAKKDPEFKRELLHGDANRAIKARFGDDLPYKVECEEEITFKIKTSDSDFESVAGGIGDEDFDITPRGNRVDYVPGSGEAGRWDREARLFPANLNLERGFGERFKVRRDSSGSIGPDFSDVSGGDGEEFSQDLGPAPLLEHHSEIENSCPAPLAMSNYDLSRVSGGSGTEEQIVIPVDGGSGARQGYTVSFSSAPRENLPRRFGRLVYGARRRPLNPASLREPHPEIGSSCPAPVTMSNDDLSRISGGSGTEEQIVIPVDDGSGTSQGYTSSSAPASAPATVPASGSDSVFGPLPPARQGRLGFRRRAPRPLPPR